MRFLHGKVKALKGGKIRVNISKATRILILNEKQFRRYKNNQTFTYFGGLKDSAYEFEVPTSGVWNVVVEKGTYHRPFEVKVAVEVEKPAAKPARALATSFHEADAAMDQQTNEDEDE